MPKVVLLTTAHRPEARLGNMADRTVSDPSGQQRKKKKNNPTSVINSGTHALNFAGECILITVHFSPGWCEDGFALLKLASLNRDRKRRV